MSHALHVTQYNQGSGAGTLVLLHGFPVDHRMWDSAAPLLDDAWQVLAVDLPGLGQSAQVLPPEPSMEASATLVIEAIDAHRSATDTTGPIVLAGLSMGGYVAQAILREHPAWAQAVVLLDTRVTPDLQETHENRLRVAAQAEADGTPNVVLPMATSTLAPQTAESRPEIVELMQGLISSQSAAGVAWSQRAMAVRPDSTEVIAELDLPLLCIVGKEDSVSPQDVMAAIAATSRHGELVVIEGAGHMSPVEQPQAVADAMSAFLAQFE